MRNNPTETPANGADRSGPSAYRGGAYNETPPDTPEGSSVMSESSAMARDLKDGTLSGFMGAGIELKGEANFKGLMRVDGHFNGKITSEGGRLIVSDNGMVEANVSVAVAQIHGTVNGDVTASQKIELGRTAKVVGNIQTPELTIEQGAVFEGNCRMTK
jgi:cytoskeletal protein CcmA (bactofilin family)